MASDDQDNTPTPLSARFFRAWASPRRRPVSFYLFLACLLMLVLGTVVIHLRDNPEHYALWLALNLIFFAVVIFRAALDGMEIATKHWRESRRIYRDTLGDSEFAQELGRRVRDNLRNRM